VRREAWKINSDYFVQSLNEVLLANTTVEIDSAAASASATSESLSTATPHAAGLAVAASKQLIQ
jgi:hypothetical protein